MLCAPQSRSLKLCRGPIDTSIPILTPAHCPLCAYLLVWCSYGFSWGDGFVTDSAKISQYGLSNPQGFFLADSATTNKYRIALAPHVYGEYTLSQCATQQSWEKLSCQGLSRVTDSGLSPEVNNSPWLN